jgi:D-alanine transaminase
VTQQAYVNGSFVPMSDARVSILDRGFLFADGVYEVVAVLGGALIDIDAHLARLERSLGEIAIAAPEPFARIAELHRELVHRNRLDEGYVYLQVTRGVDPHREFAPRAGSEATLTMFSHARPVADVPAARTGVAVMSMPDLRWARRDIKSTGLLAQVLAKREAAARGCFEAWLVQDGTVTEGASSTAFIVQDRHIVTRRNSHAILPGCTRRAIQALAEERGVDVEERAFTIAEAQRADEAFLTSATNFVLPVVRIDDRPVADGKPGPLSLRLRELYLEFARGQVQPVPA